MSVEFRVKAGVALPSKMHQWGAIEVMAGGPASLSRAMWFCERSKAVDYARAFFKEYAIARYWGAARNPNEFR